jgi:serine/threonine-protein kinase RIO1
MKICHHCKNEILLESFIGRQEQCPFCGADLHCCLNCTFYDLGAYNNCREPQAERVLIKDRSNFCDFFNFQKTTGKTPEKTPAPKDKLESLFKK